MARTNYLGSVPASARGRQRGLNQTTADATRRVPGPRPKASRAASPRVSPRLASAGVGSPPGGGGSGSPRATSPMASMPKRVINRPKTGQPRRSARLGKPRADFPTKI